jgi:hypothetical protein
MAARYRSNAPRFVDETVDGEALIMDMLKGNYYSCIGASAVAWEALKQGATVPETAALLAGAYDRPGADVAIDVENFATLLVAEEMLVATDALRDGIDDHAFTASPSASDASATLGDYGPLTFERFSDLADLILLDPVHDVTEAGWPEPKS